MLAAVALLAFLICAVRLDSDPRHTARSELPIPPPWAVERGELPSRAPNDCRTLRHHNQTGPQRQSPVMAAGSVSQEKRFKVLCINRLNTHMNFRQNSAFIHCMCMTLEGTGYLKAFSDGESDPRSDFRLRRESVCHSPTHRRMVAAGGGT